MDRVAACESTHSLWSIALERFERMAAIPPKRYRIGEVIAHSGLSRQTLHNYTMLGLIEAAERTPAGHRLYGEEVFERIERIKHLRTQHTLLEVKRILSTNANSGGGAKPSKS